jgi:hypothetical protein
MLAALVMTHIRLGTEMYWWVVVQHRQEFREAKVLAKIVHNIAAKQNLHLVDGSIHFPGTLNQHMGFSAIIYTQFPKGLPGIQWNFSSIPAVNGNWIYRVVPISEAEATIENQIFDEWSKKINRPPYSCVIDGKIQDVASINSCAQAAKMSSPPIVPWRP